MRFWCPCIGSSFFALTGRFLGKQFKHEVILKLILQIEAHGKKILTIDHAQDTINLTVQRKHIAFQPEYLSRKHFFAEVNKQALGLKCN